MTDYSLPPQPQSGLSLPLQPALLPSPLHAVSHPLLNVHDVQLWCKRDDLIHPAISGNKWRKLKYHLRYAEEQGKRHLLSFGGATPITSMPWRRPGANLACALPASYAGNRRPSATLP